MRFGLNAATRRQPVLKEQTSLRASDLRGEPLGDNLGGFVVRGGYGWFYDRVTGSGLGNHLGSPPYATRTDTNGTNNYFSTLAAPFVSQPFNTFPIRWVDFSTGLSSNVFQLGLAPAIQTPRIMSYNFNVQYLLHRNWTLEVAYVGSHGIHLFGTRAINEAQLASPADPIWGVVTTNTVTNVTLRVPYLGYGSGTNLSNWQTVFAEKFNSLQVTLKKQLSHGLQFQAAYTWLKALSDSNLQSDQNNLGLNYGPAAAYHPQRVVISYSWQIPSGKAPGILGKVVGGWALSGVTTIQDGTPLTLTDARGGTIFGLSSSTAQLCPGSTYASLGSSGALGSRLGGAAGGTGYFNLAAFNSALAPNAACALPTIGNGTGFGNGGIGTILGPSKSDFAGMFSLRAPGIGASCEQDPVGMSAQGLTPRHSSSAVQQSRDRR